ncbi:MAG: NAD(P)-dependent oxidoreductase [Nitrospirales bacterium]|nr:NAD(P)-dependent oxidoreductase [Nitrospira sp.]MDR4501499.1 NAD(P)-dependent oxidoreductase [Nitrospirales bacterium]
MQKHEFRVGFVGVGRMGANMARRLHDHGYKLTAIFDRNLEASTKVAQELGCQLAQTPAQVAESSNTILTVVSDDQATRDIFNPDSTDSLLTHASDRLFINCATISPPVHVEIEALVGQRGGQSLEACMASSITQAREGTLYLMCGGTPDAFQRASTLLQSMSSALRHIGRAGEAAKVKALVNMVMNINTAGLAEGLGVGEALGLDLTMLREVFAQTGAASRVLETDGEDMINRDHECYFSAAHAAKDSGIALRLGQEAGLSLPLAQATLDQYTRLVQRGKGDLDKSAVAELTFKSRCD